MFYINIPAVMLNHYRAIPHVFVSLTRRNFFFSTGNSLQNLFFYHKLEIFYHLFSYFHKTKWYSVLCVVEDILIKQKIC